MAEPVKNESPIRAILRRAPVIPVYGPAGVEEAVRAGEALLRGGLPVIATGRGDGTIDVRPLEVGKNPFKQGDIIVTSGTGGLYPPLVPIAKVIRLDDDGAIAIPIADPAKVSFAIVEPPFEPAALAVAAQPEPEAP